ncbi:hypothetical protein GCM10027188_28980 [Lysobacter humi (ex Lee et al. 2017)]
MQIPETSSNELSIELVRSGTSEGRALRLVLGAPHVYYLSPHTGCGCGWQFLGVGTESDEQNRISCLRLADFLSAAERAYGPLAIYSACIDSVGRAPSEEILLTAPEFIARISDLRVRYSSPEVRVFRLAPNNSSKPTPLRGAA